MYAKVLRLKQSFHINMKENEMLLDILITIKNIRIKVILKIWLSKKDSKFYKK